MKRIRCAALCAVLCAALLSPPARALLDVDGDAWYAAAVEFCIQRGLMTGVSPRYFGVDGIVTRAAAVTALYRLSGSPRNFAENIYYDVPAGAWYEPAVLWARQTGLTGGVSPHYFGVDTPVTREQLALFLFRAAGQSAAPAAADLTDAEAVSPWAAEAVAWVRAEGLMQDVGRARFAPKGSVTRAQLAQVLMDSAPLFAPPEAAAESLAGLAELCAPVALAEDADGALLLTDRYYRVLWRLKDGESGLLAGVPDGPADLYGRPAGGYHDAAAEESLFASPWGIAPFLDGWAVSDAENNAVRLLRQGSVETINASAAGGVLSLDYPTGLAADGDGNLYIADTHAGAIRRVSPAGAAETVAEGLGDPTGLCWAGGVLYCAETGENRVLRIVPGQSPEVLCGGESGYADGPAETARFAAPQGVAADGDGTLYIADTANGAVRRLRGGTADTLAGPSEGLIAPVGLLLRGGRLLVCDGFARRIFVLDPNGGEP